ncbi:uncharacterized protein LDX57_001801 [Aspergillus melleus]|uniref:uncharacterized protein n=1 Tax=Aspergillus melleus TaxID=138277 RepID=UPI001E8E84B9|nr:uncharacterized protein LDX57_001801 [Aspergillus melleus]KAH8424045.1 hypothetical protein LDX57_001801 [Aspergillus melleus]
MEDPDAIQQLFVLLLYAVGKWVIQYAASEPSDLARLSEEQKSTIISHLDGFCVQDTWDDFVERAPAMKDGLVAEVLLTALVYQDLHVRMIEHPFWYLDGKGAQDQAEDDTFGERLEYLYERFLETTNLTFGRYNQGRREAAAARLAKDLLLSGPVLSLLKTPASDEVEKKRREELVAIYTRASHAALSNDQCSGQTEFSRLADIGPTYHSSSDELSAHEYHGVGSGDTKLDGHRILLVFRPAMRHKLNQQSPEPVIWLPAVVLVEDDRVD